MLIEVRTERGKRNIVLFNFSKSLRSQTLSLIASTSARISATTINYGGYQKTKKTNGIHAACRP